jgi:hypothetical protein
MFSEALEQNNNDNITHTFLITINSNKAAKTDIEAEQYKDYILSGLKRMFTVFEGFVEIYASGHYVHKKRVNKTFKETCTNVKVNPQVEIGPELKRIHTHIVVKWDSSPKYFFQISLVKMREWILENMGPLYVNIRWIRGDSELFRYINKQKAKNYQD